MAGLVLIGATSVSAVQRVLASLPSTFSAPVVVVLHCGAGEEVARSVALSSALPVVEAEDKMALHAGLVYVAPSGYHLLVDEERVVLSTEAPVWQMRPSVDVALDAAAFAYGRRLVAVILSGAGFDGSRGVMAVRERGGHVVVQAPSSAASVGERTMLEAALARDVADRVLPLDEIAAYLTFFCHQDAERDCHE